MQVIAFDLGGVLFSEGVSVATEKLARDYGYDKDVVASLLRFPISKDLRKGLIGDEEFWSWMQKQLPAGYNTELIKQTWYDSYVLDADIFALVKELKSRYRIWVFSGNIPSRIEYLDRKYGFRKWFDGEVYSFDCHFTKPDSRFVEAFIGRVGCPPQETMYIDDDPISAAVVEKFGVKTAVYVRGAIRELKDDLRGLGVLI